MHILPATDSDIASRIFPDAVFEPTPVTTALARPTVTTVPYKSPAVLIATQNPTLDVTKTNYDAISYFYKLNSKKIRWLGCQLFVYERNIEQMHTRIFNHLLKIVCLSCLDTLPSVPLSAQNILPQSSFLL